MHLSLGNWYQASLQEALEAVVEAVFDAVWSEFEGDTQELLGADVDITNEQGFLLAEKVRNHLTKLLESGNLAELRRIAKAVDDYIPEDDEDSDEDEQEDTTE